VKTELKKKLGNLEGFRNPKASMEQYVTPPSLVADLVHLAYMKDDLENRDVVDLGSGTGSFAIAASIAGGNVKAVEKDPEAVEILKRNKERIEEEVEILEEDIRHFNGKFDTAFMNPPFSVHSDLGELFLKKALENADSVYAVLGASLLESLKEFSDEWKLEDSETYEISLPPTMGFHTEDSHVIEVEAVHLRKK